MAEQKSSDKKVSIGTYFKEKLRGLKTLRWNLAVMYYNKK